MELSDLVQWSVDRAELLLAPLGNRWLHVQGVAQAAEKIANIFAPSDAIYLMASAYLHDIGYAPDLAITGFHPLDGANFVISELGDKRLASLVAHHSGAQFEAAFRGISDLLSVYSIEHSSVADALTYCDMVTSSKGERITMKQRSIDIYQRYAKDSLVVQAYKQASRYNSMAVARTVRRLKSLDIDSFL